MPYPFEDAQTIYHAVLRGRRVSKNGPMLGHRKRQSDGSRPYVWMSYQEVAQRRKIFSFIEHFKNNFQIKFGSLFR